MIQSLYSGRTYTSSHELDQSQIAQCQTPEGYLHTGYTDAELKRMGKQLFCATCERWQFKRRRCALFVEGVQ